MLILVIVCTIIVDQMTKMAAGVNYAVTLNPGISFGWLSVIPTGILTLLLMGLLVSVWWVTRSDWATHPLAMGLFIGGSASNLVDRVWLGGVRDWLPMPLTNLHNNLADYAITVGLLLLIVRHWQMYWKQNHADEPTS